jgi:hypothetical protein
MMIEEIADLVLRFTAPAINDLEIIEWASPVPAFGEPKRSKIATLGLNPSNKEFVGHDGKELMNHDRRFHTLTSLCITDWSQLTREQLQLLSEQCTAYFFRNPYDGWFKKLDFLISGTSLSYYFPSGEACHLDLIPYATSVKWGNLPSSTRNILLEKYGDVLGTIIRDSSIQVLVLNGKTVIDNFKKISDIDYTIKRKPQWDLPRKTGQAVAGFSYEGRITHIGGIPLGKNMLVMGFNHNIQSSFGVTTGVQIAIRNWISETLLDYL